MLKEGSASGVQIGCTNQEFSASLIGDGLVMNEFSFSPVLEWKKDARCLTRNKTCLLLIEKRFEISRLSFSLGIEF